MRTPRLELTQSAQDKYSLSSAFAHFTFTTKGQTGFDLVRSVLRRRQGEQLSLKITPRMIIGAIKDISSMAFWRYFHKRLWIPREADLVLQVDIEQLPNRESRLFLSEETDIFKRKRLVIDWNITSKDVEVVRRVAELAVEAWQKSALYRCAYIELDIPEALDSFATPYDVYHPTGSLRMGKTPADSVVDGDLKLWATDNCFVTTTAVFPSAGSANPGMTHLALTARLADHISSKLEA
jgi:choline dehydrogenase-like flavoprotein